MQVLTGLQRWGLISPCPKNTMNVAAPQTDAPAAFRVQFLESLIQKKSFLPGEVPMRRLSDLISGGIYQER
jgi:hypothetical protein